ncbi:MAG: AAA family ATPase, partial [Bacillati bacterium]
YIFDSLGAAMQGDMEAAKDIVPFFQTMRSLGTVLILDHQSKVQVGQDYKDKDAFGSVYKTNLSRSVWQLRQKKPDTGEGLLLTLTHKKTNFGPLYDPIGLRATFGHEFKLEAADVPAEAKTESDTAYEKVKAALAKGPATGKRLEEITGLADSTIRGAISELQKGGYVHECGKEGKASIWALIPTVAVVPPSDPTDNSSAEPELELLKQQGRLAI